jgi:hypothetical protein
MYDPQAEDMFLTYATYMLLDPTKKSSDYTEPLFADALPNAKFNDSYSNIDTSWRNTSVMTPLFVHTQQSQPQVEQAPFVIYNIYPRIGHLFFTLNLN